MVCVTVVESRDRQRGSVVEERGSVAPEHLILNLGTRVQQNRRRKKNTLESRINEREKLCFLMPIRVGLELAPVCARLEGECDRRRQKPQRRQAKTGVTELNVLCTCIYMRQHSSTQHS